MSKHEPTMAWHPETGENQIFNHPSEVPEGWLDTHPSNVKAAVKQEGNKPLSMTRKEIVAALNDGGLSFDNKAPVKALYAQLTDAVKAVLTEAQVQFDPNADTKDLLALLPKPE